MSKFPPWRRFKKLWASYHWGLRGKSYLVSLIIAVFILGIVFAFLRREYSAKVTDAIQNWVEVTESLGTSCTNALMYEELGLVREAGLLDIYIAEMMARKNLAIDYIIISDAHKRVIAHNNLKEYGKIYDNLLARQAYGAPSTIVQRWGWGDEILEVATPLSIASKRWGTLRVGFSMKGLQKSIWGIYKEVALMGLGLLAFHFFLVTVITRKITRPILKIRDVLMEVTRGNMAVRSEVKSQDEIGFLSQTFNDMMDRLNEAKAEVERSHQRLVQSEKMASMGKLTAGLAHEINNPLGGVLTCVEALRKNSDDPGQRGKYLALIDTGLDRIHRVVKQLLDFSRPRHFEPRPTEIAPLLERVMEMVRYQLSLNRIEVIKELSPDLPSIMADSHQLMQVFVNLILNAVQAMPEGGTLLIRTWKENERVAIQVKDDGVGISPTNLARIFDPFFTTKDAAGGTGLGLAVSYGLIQNHGGEIRVESEEGEGAEFTVLLPFSKKSAPLAQG